MKEVFQAYGQLGDNGIFYLISHSSLLIPSRFSSLLFLYTDASYIIYHITLCNSYKLSAIGKTIEKTIDNKRS
jgi:hypothetical protein